MLFASAKTAAPAPVKTDETSLGTTSSSSDAHRSFCDLFEEEDVLLSAGEPQPAVRDVTEAASATAAGPTSTGSTKSTANKTAREDIEGRTLGTAATSRFFEGAAASVRRGLVGRNAPFRTPYGVKPLVYADWTATGRAVDSIEVQCAVPKAL